MNYKPTKDLLDVIINTYSPAQKALVVVEALEEMEHDHNPDNQMLIQEDLDAIMDSIITEQDKETFNETTEQVAHIKNLVKELEKISTIIMSDISKFKGLYTSVQDNAETAEMLNDILSVIKDASSRKGITDRVISDWASLSTGELSLNNNEIEYTVDENVEEALEELHDMIYEGTSIAKSLGISIIPALFNSLNLKLETYTNQIKEILNELQESIDEIGEELEYTYDEVPLSDEIGCDETGDDCC